jgi:hypothetical protein
VFAAVAVAVAGVAAGDAAGTGVAAETGAEPGVAVGFGRPLTRSAAAFEASTAPVHWATEVAASAEQKWPNEMTFDKFVCIQKEITGKPAAATERAV